MTTPQLVSDDSFRCGFPFMKERAKKSNSQTLTSLKASDDFKRKDLAMKIRSNVKAGGTQLQHNEKLQSDKKTKSLTVKTGIKAGEGDTPIIRGKGL